MTDLTRVTDIGRVTNAALMTNVVGGHGGGAPPLPPLEQALQALMDSNSIAISRHGR